jgi:hypothetical protein
MAKAKLVLRGATAAGVGALLMVSGSSIASASAARVQSMTLGRVITDRQAKANLARSSSPVTPAIPTAVATVKHFASSVKVGATTYTYNIVGKNPAKPETNAASSIKTNLVPVAVSFGTAAYTWDPTVKDSCDSGATALSRTQHSPVFAPQAWSFGGTSVGNGQVTDAFQRAEFWTDAQPAGANPTYGVNLALKVLPKITINVPVADAAAASIGCGTGYLGGVELNWLDNYLQTTVIPSLAPQGVTASTFPIFLLHNVVEYIGNVGQCCVLGYHNAFGTSTMQTYALSMYDNSGAFAGSSDVSALSHEVGEWMNDPFTTNPTPSWGHVGQVTGCQSNLEVGDPLSRTTIPDTIGGFMYHPQELAFFSWFYHQSPSLGVNGWYSDEGTFTSFAATCS